MVLPIQVLTLASFGPMTRLVTTVTLPGTPASPHAQLHGVLEKGCETRCLASV